MFKYKTRNQPANRHHRIGGWFAATCAALLLIAPMPSVADSDGYRVPFSLSLGKQLYEQSCAACHGAWAAGTDQGPPLIHKYYEPGHHDDNSFYRAIMKGVRAHHWRFGDMPPLPHVEPKKIPALIKYVRWLQAENGIVAGSVEPHIMNR